MNKDAKVELLAKMQSEMAGFEKHIQNTPEIFRNDYADELAIRQNILKAVQDNKKAHGESRPNERAA